MLTKFSCSSVSVREQLELETPSRGVRSCLVFQGSTFLIVSRFEVVQSFIAVIIIRLILTQSLVLIHCFIADGVVVVFFGCESIHDEEVYFNDGGRSFS